MIDSSGVNWFSYTLLPIPFVVFILRNGTLYIQFIIILKIYSKMNSSSKCHLQMEFSYGMCTYSEFLQSCWFVSLTQMIDCSFQSVSLFDEYHQFTLKLCLSHVKLKVTFAISFYPETIILYSNLKLSVSSTAFNTFFY